MNETFVDDLASRYAERREMDAPSGQNWREREADISRDIAEGPDKTVAGFAWNFNDQYSRYLESLVASGDFAGAKSYYDSMRDSIESNRDALLAMSQVKGAGQISDELARRATDVLMGGFNQRQVQMSDGSTVTLGQVLSDNSPYLADKNQELRNLDFSEDATKLYMGGDRVVKALMDPYLRNTRGRGGIESVPNHLQQKDLIESYVSDCDRINGIFGDGALHFVNSVAESHKASGCGAQTMRALVDLADGYSKSTGVYGRQLASDVTNGYNNLLASVFKGDDRRDENGRRYSAEISDNQRREFDAMLIPTIREAMQRTGRGFSFSDPRLRQGLLEVADVLAYTSALGGDMFSDARTTGEELNRMFGKYVAESMLGQAHTGADIVTSVRDLRNQLRDRFVGGRTRASVAASLSGQSSDYLASVDKQTGYKSTCPAADNLAASAHRFLARNLLPGMAEGKYHMDVLDNSLDANPDKMVAGLAKEFSNSFRGYAGKEFAMHLADAVLREYRDNGRVCIEDTIMRLAYSKDDTMDDVIREAGERWCRGNIAAELTFADEKRKLKDHYLAMGYTDAQARDAVASVSEQAVRFYDGGHNPYKVFESAANTGVFYNEVPEVDPRTKKPTGKMKVVVDRGRMDKTPVGPLGAGMYRDNRPAWDALQKSLAEQYRRQQEEAEFKRKRIIAAETKDM